MTMNKTGVKNELVTHIRNYDYEVVCGAAGTSFPEEYEIPRANTGFLRDQKFMNCVANVIAQLAEHYWGTQLGEQKPHSVGFTYGAARKETSRSEGMIVSVAMDYWTKLGTIPETYFNIDAEMPEIAEIVAKYPEIYEMARKYKLSGYVQLKSSGASSKDSQIKDALTKYNRGLVAVSPKGFTGGSHCIMLTGWNDKNDKYKFKNSWGANYGDNGFSEISKDKISEVYMPIFGLITMPFVDVKEDDWFYGAVKNMYFSGMMNGVSEQRFEPNAVLTRAQAATMFNRLIKYIDERFDILNKVLEDKEEYTK